MKKKYTQAWAVVVDGKIIAVPYDPNHEVCSYAVFHNRGEAIFRKKQLLESIQEDAKIIRVIITRA